MGNNMQHLFSHYTISICTSENTELENYDTDFLFLFLDINSRLVGRDPVKFLL